MFFSIRKCLVAMGCLALVLLLVVSAALVVGLTGESRAKSSFRVDYNSNTFLLDGKPFRYVSGSFHYFRALPQTWKTKLRTMRAAGLNVVSTYVEWALHNPKDDQYTFDGIANLEQFLKYAVEEDLYVILRPGPFICAERDNGGLPYWLFNKYPSIKPRTSDPDYKTEVAKWYAQLMPKVQPYLYGNGGPIIMVQIENEYGVFEACDGDYLKWLRDQTKMYVKNDALLFTTDIPNEKLSCGKIDDVFATIDFGADRVHEMDKLWKTLRTVQPNGPLVNSEFYPGWLTHWQEDNQRRNADMIADALKQILEAGANVNIYMFFGGSNFGFTAGANDFGVGSYKSDITSYDYDAPMDESGDPTIKYLKIRNVINSFLTLPTLPVPDKQPKMKLDPVSLTAIDYLLPGIATGVLGKRNITGDHPATFEELNQFSGLVFYETKLPEFKIDPTILTINDLRDRAIVLVDRQLVGVLSRANDIKSIPLSAGLGEKLQIFVENQGRINFNVANDMKGILGNVTIQKSEGQFEILKNWVSIGMPLDVEHIQELVEVRRRETIALPKNGLLRQGPVVLYGEFKVGTDKIYDTYLDPSGWGKGIVYINGFNLGRYWPLVGPQITLYVPKDILRNGVNEIVFLEYQKVPLDSFVHFRDTAKLDGK